MWCLSMWCLIIIGLTLSYDEMLPKMGYITMIIKHNILELPNMYNYDTSYCIILYRIVLYCTILYYITSC